MHTQSEVMVPCRFVPSVLSPRPQNIFILSIITNITIINNIIIINIKMRYSPTSPHSCRDFFPFWDFCWDLLSCPFPLLFAAFWSWKLPFHLYFATFWSSNLSFSLVFATFWCSDCSCRMVFGNYDSYRVGLGLVFGLVEFLLGWFQLC